MKVRQKHVKTWKHKIWQRSNTVRKSGSLGFKHNLAKLSS